MTAYYNWPPISLLVSHVKNKTLTARSQVELALGLAQREVYGSRNPTFISLHPEQAFVLADQIDKKITNGEEVGDLAGVPIAVKDNIDWGGLITSAGSPKAYNKKATNTASVLENLIRRGAIPIGKTHLNEFAVGLTGENDHFGNLENPHFSGHLTGGSSSGSARAVAMGMVPVALGSDTGGSIRIPSAWCGIVGLRPSSNSFNLDGVVPRSRTLDVVGPLTRTLDDCIYFLGKEFLPKSEISINAFDKKSIRIGWDPKLLNIVSADIKEAFLKWLDVAQKTKGAIFIEQNWPDFNSATAHTLTLLQKEFYDDFQLMCGEVSHFQSRLGPTVLAELEYSKNLKTSDLNTALFELQKFAEFFHSGFSLSTVAVDLYALPMSASGPIREKDLPEASRPLRGLTLAMGSTGLPILGIPLGLTDKSLLSLAGIQLVGRQFQEHQLLSMVKMLYAPN